MAMSGGGKGDLNSEINVTPLVDVMLVLLIIFMVTAPMLKTGVDLDLPQADTAPIPDQAEGYLILSLDKKGSVFLGETPVKWEDLESLLTKNEKVQKDHGLYIEADTALPYGLVLQTMAVAKKANVTKLMMMTEPLDTSKPMTPTSAASRKP
jgi:biopolymer transport protein TolR